VQSNVNVTIRNINFMHPLQQVIIRTFNPRSGISGMSRIKFRDLPNILKRNCERGIKTTAYENGDIDGIIIGVVWHDDIEGWKWYCEPVEQI
jgi:hypothetical protein